MKNFDTRTYNISDFVEWNNNGLLELSPDFQRRSVWTEKAKSYLIDTIIRGKPIPKILISQRLQGTKNIRIVIDGQQRLRTIFEFYNGDIKMSRVHHKEYAGKTFDDLPSEVKTEFLKYELGVDLLFDATYEEILDIFARINSYQVSLKKQELYNAKYVGYFKQASFEYGIKYVQFLIDAKVLTKAKVSRMGEAELTADIFASLLEGVQTNKNIENFYKKYEEEEGDLDSKTKLFDKTMSFISAIYPAKELANTNWRRPQLFYSIFISIAHCLEGVQGLDKKFRVNISEKQTGKLRVILDNISSRYDLYTETEDAVIPKDYKDFINYSRRGTTDTSARILRSEFICQMFINGLS